jgi:FkbM family methyltransferase
MDLESNRRAWIGLNGDKTLLLDYPLTDESIVLEVGGYRGDWVGEILTRAYPSKPMVYVFEPVREFYKSIVERFSDTPNVKALNVALSVFTGPARIFRSADSSSMHHETFDEDVEVMDVLEFFNQHKIENVDLMSVNIEGDEFYLIPRLIETGQISRIRNLQIQFHLCRPDAAERRDQIREQLFKTHIEEFCYPFVWEGWKCDE